MRDKEGSVSNAPARPLAHPHLSLSLFPLRQWQKRNEKAEAPAQPAPVSDLSEDELDDRRYAILSMITRAIEDVIFSDSR